MTDEHEIDEDTQPYAEPDPDLWRKDRDSDEGIRMSGDEIPAMGNGRHVLIVEAGGMAYIAPHLGDHSSTLCDRVGAAWVAFRGGPPSTPINMPAGRYWCDVEADGNFSIGSRLPDVVTS